MIVRQTCRKSSAGRRLSLRRAQSYNFWLFTIIREEIADATREMMTESDTERREDEGVDGRDGPGGCALSLSVI